MRQWLKEFDYKYLKGERVLIALVVTQVACIFAVMGFEKPWNLFGLSATFLFGHSIGYILGNAKGRYGRPSESS